MNGARIRIIYSIFAMIFLVACGAQATPATPSAVPPPPTSTLQPTRTPLPSIVTTTEPTITPTTVFTPSPTPWIPGNLGPIAYITHNAYTSKDEIRLVNPAAFEFQTIYTTASYSLFYSLSWSPDGRYITYGLRGLLYMLDMMSGDISELVFEYNPIWSPLAIHPLPDCTSGWTRLAAGGQARVMGAAGDPPNRVRAEPSLAGETIGQIQPGSIVTLLEGPNCADGLVFWKVISDLIPSGVGWTAEGDGTE